VYRKDQLNIYQGREIIAYVNSILEKRLTGIAVGREVEAKDVIYLRNIFKSVTINFGNYILLYLEGIHSQMASDT
jgi:hypothetical protein